LNKGCPMYHDWTDKFMFLTKRREQNPFSFFNYLSPGMKNVKISWDLAAFSWSP
jgi:hypothetical protein